MDYVNYKEEKKSTVFVLFSRGERERELLDMKNEKKYWYEMKDCMIYNKCRGENEEIKVI